MKALALIALALLATPSLAGDFRSIAEPGTVMYDAPSGKAKRLYVVSRDYPVEVMVSLDGWLKVRDAAGELTWLEKKSLSDHRTVLVTAPIAEVRQSAADQAPLAFRVEKGVAMELSEVGSSGWARIRLRDGRSGFVKVNQVWGL